MAQASQKLTGRAPLASHLRRGLREGALFIFGFGAIYFFIALGSFHPSDPGWSTSGLQHGRVTNLGGPAGAWFADVFLTLFGYLAYLFPLMVAYSGWLLFQDRRTDPPFDMRAFSLRTAGFILTLAAGCGLASLHDASVISSMPVNAGGILGDYVGGMMKNAFSFLGATLLLLALFLSGFTLATNFSWLKLMDIIGAMTLFSLAWVRGRFMATREAIHTHRAKREREST
ncbi:MAG: cell division protein FtsK, partial [Halobacteria archaeon]|nr:cell division protein FtsK [Halobacteria archaeon]